MTTQHIDTLIIGAGQAGLWSGGNWRRRNDSLRRFTPSWANRPDGTPFPGDPWAFPTKGESHGTWTGSPSTSWASSTRCRASTSAAWPGQYCFASGEVNGVGRDAAYLADGIAARPAARAPGAA
ncbi:MAG: hypothetical protein ACRDO2_00105 [Nocardioidaceae bacterium]